MKAFGYAVNAYVYAHGSWSDVGINLLRIEGLKVRKVFGYDMCRSSMIALAHINVEDMEKGDGSENCTELWFISVALLEGI